MYILVEFMSVGLTEHNGQEVVNFLPSPTVPPSSKQLVRQRLRTNHGLGTLPFHNSPTDMPSSILRYSSSQSGKTGEIRPQPVCYTDHLRGEGV